MDVDAPPPDKKTKRPHTTGSVIPEDEGLSTWLSRIWARGEVLDRIELWQMFGRNKAQRGERIYVQVFKPNEKLDIEQANKLANELVEAAQNDADSLRHAGNYQIAIVDRNRGAQPTIRRLGPIDPKRTYVVAEGSDGEDSDELPSGKTLALTYAQESLSAVRWERTRNDQVLGHVIQVLLRRLESSESQIDRLMGKVITFFETAQTAMDRSADREFAREREKFKLDMWRDGWRTARNLVPGLFADKGEKSLPASAEKKSEPERALVDNFLSDVEQSDEKLKVALFGDFEEKDGKLAQVAPGIFSVAQYAVLEGVRQGKLPVLDLQKLMPKSGHELEISEEQIKSAMGAGVTEGMASALVELIGLLSKRAEETKK